MNESYLQTVYENEEDRQLARILSILIWATWGAYLFVILVNLYYEDWKAIAVTLAGGVLLSAAWILLRRGHLRASSLFFVLSALFTVTLIATVGQGIRDLGIVAFPIVFIFAGLTLDRRLFRVCVGLALVAVCWLALGEVYGWFVTKPFDGEMSNWLYLIGTIVILLVAALAVELLAINMRNNLELARQEIAQRKQAEEALRASEKKYRALFDMFPLGITVANKDGKISESNREAERLLGISKAEQERRAIDGDEWQIIRPDGSSMQPEEYASVRALKENRLIENVEMGILKGEGSVTWINVTAVPVGDSEIVIAYQDVTERKQMDEALRENEERLRLSLQAANQGLYDLNVQTGAAIVNREYAQMLGYEPETFIETNAAWIERLHPDDHEITSKAYSDYVNGLTSEYRIEFRQETKDGQWKWILSLGKIVEHDADGKPLRMVGTHTDITERKQAEDEIRQLNASLELRVEERTQELRDAQEQLVRKEKLSVLGQMAGSVGHELRNSLGVISNAVYFLKMVQTDAPDKVKEYLNLIEKNVHISDKIVGDLLDFTRVKSVDRAAVSVPDLIQQTLERFPAPENIQVKIEIPADLPQAYADPQHVIQILGNLVLNACQAMPDGGKLSVVSNQLSVVSEQSSVKTDPLITAPLITDTSTALSTGHWILITVRDTGAGISPEHKKKLFEPLFTTKPKGIGLGLAVCQKLIEANGGRIEVESDGVPGAGSAFTLYLPIHRSAA